METMHYNLVKTLLHFPLVLVNRLIKTKSAAFLTISEGSVFFRLFIFEEDLVCI